MVEVPVEGRGVVAATQTLGWLGVRIRVRVRVKVRVRVRVRLPSKLEA